jgi:hypothetical protein
MGDSAYYEGELLGNTPYPCIRNLPCASRSFLTLDLTSFSASRRKPISVLTDWVDVAVYPETRGSEVAK